MVGRNKKPAELALQVFFMSYSGILALFSINTKFLILMVIVLFTACLMEGGSIGIAYQKQMFYFRKLEFFKWSLRPQQFK